MKVDCQWIDKNLEALFCGTLSPQDQERAHEHIGSCGTCGKEVAALNSIDPMVKKYFQAEFDRVLRGSAVDMRHVARGRLIAVSTGTVIAASLLVALVLLTSHLNRMDRSIPATPEVNSSESSATQLPSKTTDSTTVERTKPTESAPVDHPQPHRTEATTATQNAPDFLVSDPAGYSRTIADYRGYIFVIGILDSSQLESAANLERIYKAFNSNAKFRFLGVASDRQSKPANITLPIAYNHGSKLFGARPGDFVLLDETGSILLRGSLTKDLDGLQKTLQEK